MSRLRQAVSEMLAKPSNTAQLPNCRKEETHSTYASNARNRSPALLISRQRTKAPKRKCLFFRFCRKFGEHLVFPFFVDELGCLFHSLRYGRLLLTGHGLLRVSTKNSCCFFLLYHRWDLLSLFTSQLLFSFRLSFSSHALLSSRLWA